MTVPLYNLTDTWNSGATVFTAILMNVTDSASDDTSLLMDLQVGGNSVVTVPKRGAVLFPTGSFASVHSPGVGCWGGALALFGGGGTLVSTADSLGLNFDTNITLSWALDTYVRRDAADILAQRNSINAQTLRVYNTFTDSSNYERHTVDWNTTANVCYVRNEALGTGAARLMVPVTGSTTVGGLPSASTAGAGARAFVTDATATTYNSTVAGTGSNKVPVVSDGTNWLIG